MKVGLPAHEVSLFNTRRVKKKESIAAAECCPPVVKNEVLYSVSRAFFTRGSTSLMSFFFHLISTRTENSYKSSLLVREQEQKSLFD